MSLAFDTLKFVETLEAGGFAYEQAKAAAEAFAEATSQELATKAVLPELELRMRVKLRGESSPSVRQSSFSRRCGIFRAGIDAADVSIRNRRLEIQNG